MLRQGLSLGLGWGLNELLGALLGSWSLVQLPRVCFIYPGSPAIHSYTLCVHYLPMNSL